MWEEHGVARPCLTFFSLYGLLCSLRVCVHAPARCGALGSPGARTRRRGTLPKCFFGPGTGTIPCAGGGSNLLWLWLQIPPPSRTSSALTRGPASCLPTSFSASRLGPAERKARRAPSLSCGERGGSAYSVLNELTVWGGRQAWKQIITVQSVRAVKGGTPRGQRPALLTFRPSGEGRGHVLRVSV